jgi:glycosyltransferase involved in cell wall biosynthesis
MSLYYSAADLLVMTSLHEGSPNTVKEAMACNCPVVSTPVGDVPFLLNGIQGCYVSSSDQQDFADNINRAMEFARRFDRTAGRERLLALGLDSGTVAGRIRDIYEKVLESN